MTRGKALIVLLGLLVIAVTFDTVAAFGNSASAKREAQSIQAQRIDLIRSNCLAQNERHARTIMELDRILHRAERSAPPLRRAQLEESRASTVLLINQLAPHQNCRRVVREGTTSRQ